MKTFILHYQYNKDVIRGFNYISNIIYIYHCIKTSLPSILQIYSIVIEFQSTSLHSLIINICLRMHTISYVKNLQNNYTIIYVWEKNFLEIASCTNYSPQTRSRVRETLRVHNVYAYGELTAVVDNPHGALCSRWCECRAIDFIVPFH